MIDFTNDSAVATPRAGSAAPATVERDGQPEVAATDIAVVGRAVRLPGARSVREYWSNLEAGVESIRRLTDEELRAAGVSESLLHDPNYVKVASTLEGVELFDAGFFGFSPREAAIMDPQHRHFLEVAWEALEDAGYTPGNFEGRIGVFGGSGMNAYMPYHLFTNPKLMASSGLFLVRHTGNDKDFLTTRVSYLFDLRGPSVNIQTACSTSLVAIHAGCQSLINRECDMALAGGVTIELPHGQGYLYQDGEILSDDGRCRAFDRSARGTVFGSGAGIVVLRRLEDAIADRDSIYAVVKGSAVNNDGGRKIGYLAPSVDGQAEAVAEAIHMSGVPAETISYVECHGTGTPVGDPIEIAGLTEGFRSLTSRTNFCHVGSVKTNIGHLDTAAGVAGFVKVVEMLRHRMLVPTLHFREPNPEVEWSSTPFVVSERTMPWRASGLLRGSVNSLGVGGTNAHVVLEQAPSRPVTPSTGPTVLVLSARSKPALHRAAQRLADHLEREMEQDLADVAFTLATGRKTFAERRAVVAPSREAAVAALRAPAGAAKTASADRVAFLFPGGGAQYPGMAADLYAQEPVFRAFVDRCLELLSSNEGLSLRPLMFPAPGDETGSVRQLTQPSFALPALLTIELGLAELLRAWGLVPAAMLGHSMGEYAAAHLSGVFSLRDVLSVVAYRGRLFDTLPEGAMLSVPLPESEVTPLLGPGLSFAAINGPGLCLVSGEVAAIQDLSSRLEAHGVEARRLAINVAAHSPMLDPILGKFEAYVRSLRLSNPTLPFVSNVTGTWIRPEEARDPGYWVRHLRQPVRFAAGLSTLLAMPGCALLEVGPGRTLTSLAQAHPELPAGHPAFSSLRHPQDPSSDCEALLGAVGRLWSAGVTPDWKAFFGPGRQRVSLPTYSFDHERHWIEPGSEFFLRAGSTGDVGRRQDRSRWTYRPVWRVSQPADREGQAPRAVLLFDDGSALGRELALDLRAAGHAVDIVGRGEAFSRAQDGTTTVRPDSRDDHAALLRDLGQNGRAPTQIIHLWSVGSPERALDAAGAATEYFFPLVALSQALIDEEPSAPIELVVVTDGADAAGGEAAPRFPFKALAQGPVRVLPREMPTVSCRMVDLPDDSLSAAVRARLLASELDIRTSDARVAIRERRRFVETYELWPLAAVENSWAFRERGVVLVTGGLGGIALALAERLARESKARFVLVGRTPLPDREEWSSLAARLDPSDPMMRRIRAIQAIDAAGGEVFPFAADVSSLESMEAAIAAADERFGSVDAAIHAAGIIDDAPLHSKDRGRFEAVLRPKVDGAVALVEALRGRSLDFLVLFSSTSAALGPPGQIDYVAGNAFLNAYARHLSAQGVPAKAVQWGPWREVGMAAAALSRALPGGGEPIEHPLLQRQVRDAGGHLTIFCATLNARQWVLDDHRLRGSDPVLPGTGVVEMMRAAAAASLGTENGAIELFDVTFSAPLPVAPDSSVGVATEVRHEADGSLTLAVRSVRPGGANQEHATGRARALPGWAPPALDLAAIEARCSARTASFEAGEQKLPQDRLLAFGPRWKVIRRFGHGLDEGIAQLELPDAFAADLDHYALHPGLLDMATGFAFGMIDAPSSASSLFVPLSYGMVRVVTSMPRRLFSHVRIKPGSGNGVGVLDATLADEQGHVVAEIREYVVKAVDAAVLKPARQVDAVQSPLARWVEQGILADEGFDVLGRILRQQGETQVLVSPLDFHAMLTELGGSGQSAAPAAAPAEPSTALVPADAQPRDEVEQRLAAMWRELLGVDAVKLSDGFMDLGGHSLIAVRLFARIRKTWGVDLPLATLFRAPTLDALAAVVRERLGLTLDTTPASSPAAPAGPAAALAPTWTPLVAIKQGGARQPFFCVHGAGGNLLNFRECAQRLSSDQPVYGLEARGVDGQFPPSSSVREMAELYLSAIRTVQAKGPYLLGGYSGGGVVALEMARMLTAAGEQVSDVALLDTFHPSTRARNVGIRQKLEALRDQGVGYMFRSACGIATRHTLWAWRNWRLQAHLRRGTSVPHELREWHLTTAFIDALAQHSPGHYAGSVTLFRAKSVGTMYSHVGARLGWEPAILPALDVVEVPGTHDTMVKKPNVNTLAAELDAFLRRARA